MFCNGHVVIGGDKVFSTSLLLETISEEKKLRVFEVSIAIAFQIFQVLRKSWHSPNINETRTLLGTHPSQNGYRRNHANPRSVQASMKPHRSNHIGCHRNEDLTSLYLEIINPVVADVD